MAGDLNRIIEQKELLEKKLSEQSWGEGDEYVSLTKEYRRMSRLAELKTEEERILGQLKDNNDLLAATDADDEMYSLLLEDSDNLNKALSSLDRELKLLLIPPGKNDGRPVIVEIRAGTGGDEASLFSADLFRMYQRYAEKKGLAFEVMSVSESERGGFKEVVFALKGDEAWRLFKYESGTHRVQRVPVTESSGRIHTSAVTVAIMAEPEDVDIEINPNDIRIDTFRSSGPGGQSVNTMDSAIRITHFPSGIVVSCQDEKSQLKNKLKAMRILKARLLAKIQQEEQEKRSQNRKHQIGSGDRSEKIRTYNYPQNRLSDHRINLTLYSLTEIVNGDLDELIFALSDAEFEELSKDLGENFIDKN